jgi:hypothetical protein
MFPILQFGIGFFLDPGSPDALALKILNEYYVLRIIRMMQRAVKGENLSAEQIRR